MRTNSTAPCGSLYDVNRGDHDMPIGRIASPLSQVRNVEHGHKRNSADRVSDNGPQMKRPRLQADGEIFAKLTHLRQVYGDADYHRFTHLDFRDQEPQQVLSLFEKGNYYMQNEHVMKLMPGTRVLPASLTTISFRMIQDAAFPFVDQLVKDDDFDGLFKLNLCVDI
ncbi:Arginase-like protein [Sodalis praecaptivus]|uniref:Arginase-like protein n=1 Tax=Sodalis praecaptivus TaxID=1239307 RepID=W0I3J4_9GAMM|nr:hypothetical protein [Sodalis praecaptivus]AHF78983.1 Arginase-like protein [Sodalis praecaptivus]